MVIVKLNIRSRLEEVPVIGKFLIDSLTSNIADFTAFSPDYSPAFLTNATNKLTLVSNLINSKQLTGELKVITLRLYGSKDALRPKIDFLEGYIKRATNLTIGVKDFGISEVRKANNRGDVEGLINALTYLLTNATNNMAALTAKGYSAAQHTSLTNLKTSLSNDNASQNAKINERNNKVTANYGVINDFWAICTDISDAGKRIFKSTATNKVDDFTVEELKRRIRQEQKRNKFLGFTGCGGKTISNAKIEMLPVEGGRRRTTKSDEKGVFEIKSLIEGLYIVGITAEGFQTESAEVKIERGGKVEMKFEMKRNEQLN